MVYTENLYTIDTIEYRASHFVNPALVAVKGPNSNPFESIIYFACFLQSLPEKIFCHF
jgi:hypothetical protein